MCIMFKKTLTKEQENEIVKIYTNSYMTVKKLAKDFNMSSTGMTKLLKRHNVQTNRIYNIPEKLLLKFNIVDLYLSELPLA